MLLAGPGGGPPVTFEPSFGLALNAASGVFLIGLGVAVLGRRPQRRATPPSPRPPAAVSHGGTRK